MATVFRCDKCDAEHKTEGQLQKVIIENVGTKELCDRCIRRLRDWLQPDPKEGVPPFRTVMTGGAVGS